MQATFTGKEYDEETDIQYFGARYYDNQIGRFTAIDPALVYQPQNFLLDPQQLNNYSYTRNNPVRYIDPTGKYTVETDDNDKTTLILEQGDTLSHVAQFFGMDYNELAGNLGIDDPNRIYAGDSYDVTPLALGSIYINLKGGYYIRAEGPSAGSTSQYHAHLYNKSNPRLELASENMDGSVHDEHKGVGRITDYNDKIKEQLSQNKKWQQLQERNQRHIDSHRNDKSGGSSAGGSGTTGGGGSVIPGSTNLFFMPIMSAPVPLIFEMPLVPVFGF